MLAQLVLLDERARNNKGILQTFSLPECDVEKGIAEIGPLGLVPAARQARDEPRATVGQARHFQRAVETG